MARETFTLETVTLSGTETIFEISEDHLHRLHGLDVVKMSEIGTYWVLNEDSEFYEVALILLSLGDHEDDEG